MEINLKYITPPSWQINEDLFGLLNCIRQTSFVREDTGYPIILEN